MPKISIQSLIKAAPMTDEMRNDLLARAPNFTEDEKYTVESILWTRLSLLYTAQLQKKINDATLDELSGGRSTTPNDYAEMELGVTREFAKKLESASTEEEVSHVREQLKEYQATPFKQDPVDPNFKPRVDPSSPLDRPQDLMKKTE